MSLDSVPTTEFPCHVCGKVVYTHKSFWNWGWELFCDAARYHNTLPPIKVCLECYEILKPIADKELDEIDNQLVGAAHALDAVQKAGLASRLDLEELAMTTILDECTKDILSTFRATVNHVKKD